jgi:hypothetical protein
MEVKISKVVINNDGVWLLKHKLTPFVDDCPPAELGKRHDGQKNTCSVQKIQDAVASQNTGDK